MGRLTKDPEVRYTQTTNAMVTSFTLAVNRRIVMKGQERQADFLPIIAWSKTAEFVAKYFKKGQQVAVIGRVETRNYDDKDGKKVYVTEVIAEEAYFADSKKEEGTATAFTPDNGNSFVAAAADTDLPF